MKIAGASGDPIRQALIPGPFLMARWLKSRGDWSDGAMEYWPRPHRYAKRCGRSVGLLRLRRIAPRWSRGWGFLQRVSMQYLPFTVASKHRLIRQSPIEAGVSTPSLAIRSGPRELPFIWKTREPLRRNQKIAAHESPRTTKLYDRTNDHLTLDEIERISV